MGHLLSTVNPAAAAAIGREHLTAPAAGPLPGIGDVVIYIARPGEGRAGRTEFPLLVTRVTPDGGVDGVMIYDYDDMVGRANVHRKSEAQPFACWDFREGDLAATVASLAASLAARINALEASAKSDTAPKIVLRKP